MEINALKYSSSEIDDPLSFNSINSPYENSSKFNIYKHKTNNDSYNSILNNLSKSFDNFYESALEICHEINNNNLTLGNQILYIQYLLSVIKNKIAVDVDINNEIEKLCNHLEKINFNKKNLDKNILIINNACINYHNNFQKIYKKLKNVNYGKKIIESNKKRGNSYIIEDNNINYEYNNYSNIINFKNNYNSCKTSIDKDKDNDDNINNKINKNIRYAIRNNSALNSPKIKKLKRVSYDINSYNNKNKYKSYLNGTNSSFFDKKNLMEMYQMNSIRNNNKKIRLFNIKSNFIEHYKIKDKKSNYEKIYFNGDKKNKNKGNRCSSASKTVSDVNIIKNINDKDCYLGLTNNKLFQNKEDNLIKNKSNVNININYNKLEIELALKVITFIKIINTIEDRLKNYLESINGNKHQLDKLKNYILYLSQNILNKYNNKKNNKNFDNNIDINKNYKKLLIDYKNNLENLQEIKNENIQMNSKYIKLNKSYNILRKKYDNLYNLYNSTIINKKSPKKQNQIKYNNNNKDLNLNNELLLSKKLNDITKLSHQNSIYLLEINKLQKEKDSLLQKLEEKEKYIISSINSKNKNINVNGKENTIKKSDSHNSNLVITKNSFYIDKIKSNNNKIEISSFYNMIKAKEDNIEDLKKEVNKLKNNNLNLQKEIKQKNNEIENLSKKINELNKINNINIINNKDKISSKLQNEIIQKNNEIENMNIKINELNEINNKNDIKIKELIKDKNDNEKKYIEKIDNLINNNKKLKKENDEYINNNKNNINEINNQKNIINELQKKLNTINELGNKNNKSLNIDESLKNSIKDGKEINTPSFLSFEKNSKNLSLDENRDSNDINNNNNINIIKEYESKIKLLKESNNQFSQLNDELQKKNESISKELEEIKNSNNKNNKKIFKADEYIIICDKSKDELKWYLIKNKKDMNDKNSYNNLVWVDSNSIENIKNYNKFKSEDEEMNNIIINYIKKLEEKEELISQLRTKLHNYEKNSSSINMDISRDSQKKIHKSKSEQTIKNKTNNFTNGSKNKFNKKDEFVQNLDDNIRDDYSKNSYFYLEGNGLGLLNS